MMPSVLQKPPPWISSSPSYESSLKVLHLSPKEFKCLNNAYATTQDKLTAKTMLQVRRQKPLRHNWHYV